MKKLTVEPKGDQIGREYPIIIKQGLLGELDDFLPKRRFFLVTNKKIANLYASVLEKFENTILIEDGEEFKNFDTYKMILDKLLEAKIERSDCLVAFGGGVVGDITGFVAATVLRGIDFIQIPTTLLAQVDSSVGGKTGINHHLGKNLIGAFYQPKMVLIDANTLKTLDERQIKTGLGEVIKYAFIEKSCGAGISGSFFDKLLNASVEEPDWEDIIYTCCALKAAVVKQDEREKGLRAILNLGHTFAHAIEKVSSYCRYTHGEAVGMGIKMALKLSLKMGLIEDEYYRKGLELLEKYGLDLELDKKYPPDELLEAMKSDKKVQGGKIKLVLPVGFSQVELFADIDETLLKETLL